MSIQIKSTTILKNNLDFFKKLLLSYDNNIITNSTATITDHVYCQTIEFVLSYDIDLKKSFNLIIKDENENSSIKFVVYKKDDSDIVIDSIETPEMFLHDGLDFLKKINNSLYNKTIEKEIYDFIYSIIKECNFELNKEEESSFKLMKEYISLPISKMIEEDEFFNVLYWSKKIIKQKDKNWIQKVTEEEKKRMSLILSLN